MRKPDSPHPSPGSPPTLRVSRFDLERLERLLDRLGDSPDYDRLREELDRAEVLEPQEMPADVVTMNSRVRFADVDSGEESEISLVFPRHADPEAGRISILAPVGSALLGLSVGATIEWPVPDGRKRRLRVVAIAYQPEAAGDFEL
ncbi:MAG: nucleoside diphosphate kinase regulator [Proteobacteria bacterium]|nr:MAG: nucleoside diphosphate kinase regulator [Pseudomonadota bacterium]